jgi:hypothetical protein
VECEQTGREVVVLNKPPRRRRAHSPRRHCHRRTRPTEQIC